MAPVNNSPSRARAVAPSLKQLGFSLVELMVSVVLGMVVVGAAVAVYVAMLQSSTGTVRTARLNYDMGSLMTYMANDIRRAGFWGNAAVGADPLLNPFTAAAEDIQILADWDGNGNPCIVYSYDADSDGAQQDTERFGFRLNDDGSIGMRMDGSVLASCLDGDGDGDGIDDGTWERVTVQDNSEIVQVTDLQLSFQDLPADTDGSDGAGPYPVQPQSSWCDNIDDGDPEEASAPDCSGLTNAPSAGDALVVRRLVNIRMTGQAGRDAEISRSLATTVKLANDRLFRQP